MNFSKLRDIYYYKDKQNKKIKMETTGNTEQIMNITFTDVMQVIASNDTKPTEKMVYIYLLNVIMDLDEKIEKLERRFLNEDDFNKNVDVNEDVD